MKYLIGQLYILVDPILNMCIGIAKIELADFWGVVIELIPLSLL
jgi:hypothetical protein